MAKQIVKLQWIIYGGPKQRTYPVLTFEYGGKAYRILEDLTHEDAVIVLHACWQLGVNIVEPIDDATRMNLDIEKRGWWIKPWRPVEHEEHPMDR